MKNNILYVVYRQGNYIQGIYGVYTSLKRARWGAKYALEAEPDDYHTIRVMEMRLDEYIGGEGNYDSKPLIEFQRRISIKEV